MIKLASCTLLFISCCLMGFLKASAYKARSRELESILELMRLIELEISYKKEPLAKTFQKAAMLKPCWFSEVLQSSSNALSRQRPLQESWQEAITMHQGQSPLQQQDMEILKDLALGLGKSDTAGQIRIMKPAAIRLTEQLEAAREQERKQGRMYRGLGISAGVVIVIMIL